MNTQVIKVRRVRRLSRLSLSEAAGGFETNKANAMSEEEMKAELNRPEQANVSASRVRRNAALQ